MHLSGFGWLGRGPLPPLPRFGGVPRERLLSERHTRTLGRDRDPGNGHRVAVHVPWGGTRISESCNQQGAQSITAARLVVGATDRISYRVAEVVLLKSTLTEIRQRILYCY